MPFRPLLSPLLLFLLCTTPASALDAPDLSGPSSSFGPSAISSQRPTSSSRSSVVAPSATPSATLPSDLSSGDFSPYTGAQITSQRMGENLCAITFDDGPSVYTPHLLDMLDAYEITATFFMLGKNAQHYPDIVRRVAEEGHEVASHSFSHPNFKHISLQRRIEELSRTNDILRSLGAEPVLFRPPYGAKDGKVVEIARQLGLRVVTWSYDTLDWKHLPEDYTKLVNASGKVATPGHLRGIFLFHDIHKTTVDDLPRIVAQLRAGGCQRFVSVSDYMNETFLDPEPPLLMTPRPRPASLGKKHPQADLPHEIGAKPLPADTSTMPLHAVAPIALPATAPAAEERSSWIAGTAPWNGFAVDPIAVRGPQRELAATSQHRSVQELVLKLAQSIVKKEETAPQKTPAAPSASFRKGAVLMAPSPGSKTFLLRPVAPVWSASQN